MLFLVRLRPKEVASFILNFIKNEISDPVTYLNFLSHQTDEDDGKNFEETVRWDRNRSVKA
jgi:hypothetical protein